MSGGAFDYKQFWIAQIAEDIEQHLQNQGKLREDVDNPYQKEFYDKYPDAKYEPTESDIVQEKIREAIKTLKIAHIYAQRVDWYLSGDDGEESFINRLEQSLKELEGNKEVD